MSGYVITVVSPTPRGAGLIAAGAPLFSVAMSINFFGEAVND